MAGTVNKNIYICHCHGGEKKFNIHTQKMCHIPGSALYCFPFNSKLANLNPKVLHKFSSILHHHHPPTCITEPDVIYTIIVCMKRADCVLRAVMEDYYIHDNQNHYLKVMQYNEVHIPTAVTTFRKKFNLMHSVSVHGVVSRVISRYMTV